MNEPSPLPDPSSRPDVDGLLRDFFRSELPHPWPRLHLPETRQRVVPSWWQRSRVRIGLAASVALVLTSYLALADLFPRSAPSRAVDLRGPNIADLPKHRTRTHAVPRPEASTERPESNGR